MGLQPFQYQGGAVQIPRTNFNVQPAAGPGTANALQGLTNQVNRYGEQKRADEATTAAEAAKQQAVDKFAAMKKEMMEAMATDDPKIINATVQKYAEFQEAFKIAEQHGHKSKRTLNNSQELSYAYLEAETDAERQALVDERIRVLNEEGVPPEQRAQTEEFLVAHYEGNTEDAKRMLHDRLMIGDNKRYNEYLKNTGQEPPDKKESTSGIKEYQFAVSNDGYKGTFEQWQKKNTGPKSSPATDIDDYVADDILARRGDKEAAARNKARLRVKRPQAPEAYDVTRAEETAKGDTAQRKAYETELGKAMADIQTATEVIHARGDQTPAEKKAEGAKAMSTKLRSLRRLYISLNDLGAMVNVDNPTVANVSAKTRASDVGRFFGKAFGTDEEQLRSAVDKVRPLLIQDIRKASEMGTRGMDSEKELAFYMQAVTDVESEFTTNLAALAMLDEVYGDGKLAQEIRQSLSEKDIKKFMQAEDRLTKEGKEVLDGRDTPTIESADSQAYKDLGEGEAFFKPGDPTPFYKPYSN